MYSFAQKDENGIRVSLHVQPGASRNEIAGTHGEALKVRIRARAESGEANKELCSFLSELFSVPKTSVTILRGHAQRQKVVLVVGKSESLLELLEKFRLK